MIFREQQEVDDRMRRADEASEHEWPVARLFDLRKVYHRISKPSLWGLLEEYGINERCLESLMDLNECTEYKVRGKEDTSETSTPAKVLTCGLNHLLHSVQRKSPDQAVMRQTGMRRRERGGNVGVAWRGYRAVDALGTETLDGFCFRDCCLDNE